MRNTLLYASEDRKYIDRIWLSIPDIQFLKISPGTPQVLRDIAVHRVLLLMSIDLMHRLVCEAEYRPLYRQLKLFDREGIVLVLAFRACAWKDHFSAPAYPSGEETLIALRAKRREAIYKEVAAAIRKE